MPFARSQPFWHLKNVGFSPIRLGLLAGAIALMCLAGLAAMTLAFRANAAQRWVEHTVDVRQLTGEFLSTALDAETSVRGYLLSDDETFLEAYRAATPKLKATLERLQALTADNPSQNARLQQISRTAEQLSEVYRRMLDFVAQGQREAAIGLVKTRAGKGLMDEARSQIAAFDKVEREMLVMRERNAARLRAMLMAAVVGALACAIGLLLFFGKMSYDYVRQLDIRTAELENEARRRRESEATLVQAQKMEAVGQLTGGIAHDFNNMLTVIIGSLETLQRRLKHMQTENDGGDKLAVLTKPADLALQGARNAAKLTHRLLAFARRQPLAPVQLDLNKVVSGMSELMRRTVGETIVFETVLGAGLWRTFVDANQLENVLLNLVVNARDAMPNGGHLTIETANAYLDDAYAARFGDVVAGQYLLLSVTDTGTGMTPGAAGAGVRAVLQHQGRPAGLRPRAGDGARLRQAVRRSYPHLQRAQRRHIGQNLPAADQGGGSRRQSGGTAAARSAGGDRGAPRGDRAGGRGQRRRPPLRPVGARRAGLHRAARRATAPRRCGSSRTARASTCCLPMSSCPAA